MATAVALPNGATLGDDPRIQRCGFAKLQGKDLEYIVRKYDVLLGRKSKASNVDVVLGDHMSVSRQHARIYYNFKTHEWQLEVLGKNGVSVNGTNALPGMPPVILNSKALIQIGQDVSFHFLLPKAGFSGRPVIGETARHASLPPVATTMVHHRSHEMAVHGGSPLAVPEASTSPFAHGAAASEHLSQPGALSQNPNASPRSFGASPAAQDVSMNAVARGSPLSGQQRHYEAAYGSTPIAAAHEGQYQQPREELPPSDQARRLQALMANVQSLPGNSALLESLMTQGGWQQQQVPRQASAGTYEQGTGSPMRATHAGSLNLANLTPQQLQALQALRNKQQYQ